jgi:hypothetical protein
MANADDNFDELFAEIMSEGTGEAAAEVSEEPAAVATLADSREALIEQVIAEPVAETGKPDARKEYRTVEKTEVEGGPENTVSKVYPLGYLSLVIRNGFRFQNKACFYGPDLESFIEFCRSDKADAWLAALKDAGLRARGEARKEG